MKLSVLVIKFIFFTLSANFCNAQCDSCSSLLEQMKNDKDFISFMATNEAIVNAYVENAKNSPRPNELRTEDSLYMRDTLISIEEKFDRMGYKGLKIIKDLNLQAMELLSKLEISYPLLKDLREEEYPIFFKLATEYYKSLKLQ